MGLDEEEVFSLFKDLKVRPKRLQRRAAAPRLILDNMDPYEFEELVARVYEAQGYVVQRTGGSHDAGIDILAEKVAGPARERVAVQCKHQRDNVGRPALQQLWGVVSDDNTLTRGDLVSSGNFTIHAREFASEKRLTLIDGQELARLVEEHHVAEFVTSPD